LLVRAPDQPLGVVAAAAGVLVLAQQQPLVRPGLQQQHWP
jgi:hypothetical protein